MSPRLTDWSLAVAVWVAFATGVISLVSGRGDQWLVFAAHGAAGFWLLLLSYGKLRRVWWRLVGVRGWDWRTSIGISATLCVILVGGSGVWWVTGGELDLLGFNLLNWHIALGLGLTFVVALHMLARAKPLRERDVRGRRQALRWGGMALIGAALWPIQRALAEGIGVRERRFTGSREAGSFLGNTFPSTSWVADNPQPISITNWQLQVGGAVAQPLTLDYAAITAPDTIEATLDCTGGFYSTQQWRGMPVGRILDQAGVLDTARYVSFVGVTGYRWSLPIEDARAALLATHVGGEVLSHAHGAPVRLVAPGQRGFVWVKWLTRIELLTGPDPAEIFSLYTSSFTREGRGM